MRAYAAVTAAYWAFMATDGALRMLVLLQFHGMGFSALQLAWLFLLYEAAGVVTNLAAGWIGARFGLRVTLWAGLALQIAALVGLALGQGLVWVMAVQGVSGVAKDLAKMSSKSAVKLLAPGSEGALFRWVALLTGSKNAVKGLGFFLGAALLALVGFEGAVLGMAAGLGAVLVAVWLFLPPGLPGGKKGVKLTSAWSRDARINRLSLARLFLFGARDVWFVVGLPVWFQQVLSDGTEEGRRAAFFLTGGFMALWIIGYGAVQAAAPRLVGGQRLAWWSAALVPIPFALALAVAVLPSGPLLVGVVALGLVIFGVVFALNSALHSFLILAFAGKERVTQDVGFYYMANAAGRLVGTLLSGLSYQEGGLVLCLATAGGLTLLNAWASRRLG